MEATQVAPLIPRCPACSEPLAPATCTVGAVLRCPKCQVALSLELKKDKGGLTFEIYQPEALPTRLPAALTERFEVRAVLGAGGQGEVLRVRPRGATRDFALKWTRAQAGGERGPREANYAVMPAHPNVVAPLQAGWCGTLQYMVFDLIEGETLAALLRREGPQSPQRALAFAHQAARALAHVHENKVIHRDVKPANMLLAGDGTLRLTDFGVATSVGTPPTDDIIGTPPYMAPEQVSLTEQTPAIDVYALGCVLFELLTGKPPYVKDALFELMLVRLTEDAPRVRGERPDTPEPIDAFVARLLARDPRDRPADGAALLAEFPAVQRACGFDEHVHLPVAPRATERYTELERTRARHRLRLPAGLVLVGAVLATGLMVNAFPTPVVLGLHAAAWVLLWLGAGGLSAERLGHRDAWWRSYLDPSTYDALSFPTAFSVGLTIFAVGWALVVGLGHNSFTGMLVVLWYFTFALASRVLVPAMLEIERTPELSDAPPELRVFVPEEGWHYRILPQGQERPLAHRIELAEGLNRMEVWRTGGLRRSFALWATSGMQLAMRLADAPDGPRVVYDAQRALPPARPPP